MAFVWFCSFEPGMLHKRAPQLAATWPAMCLRLAAAGLTDVKELAFGKYVPPKSQHFIHGIGRVAEGVVHVHTGALTNWSEASFAVHDWLAAPPDSYSLQIEECWWFNQPVRVFSRQCGYGGDKEANIDIRSNSMTFRPTALQLLLGQSLQACPEMATTTANHIFQQFQICPTEVVAVQVAAPFIDLFRKKQLLEIIACASWGPILPGYPPAWFGRTHMLSSDASSLGKMVKGLAAPRLEVAQPWEKFQSDVVAIRHLARRVSQWDGALQNEVLQTIQHLEEVDFLVSDEITCAASVDVIYVVHSAFCITQSLID